MYKKLIQWYYKESLQLLEAHASLTAKSQEMTSQLQKQQEYINSLVQGALKTTFFNANARAQRKQRC